MKRPPGRVRAVFDCNTLVQALAPAGAGARCAALVESADIELFISKPTLAELRRVLAYEHIRAIGPHMTPQRIARFVRWLAFRATLLRQVPHVWDYSRDPDDEPYVDLAVSARADFLVTCDKDLLSLMTSHSITARQFRQLTHPLQVVTPPDFLHKMRQAVT